MNNEIGMRVLTSLVALGIFIPFILMQHNEKNAHLAENLEKIAFVITFLIICIAFICLYKPI